MEFHENSMEKFMKSFMESSWNSMEFYGIP
jgi:hypothetical protein